MKTEKFCREPKYANICEKAFENDYFQAEKMTYDKSYKSHDKFVDIINENECPTVNFLLMNDAGAEYFPMEVKMCHAIKENEDNTPTSAIVFLQSPYDEPLDEALNFFVLKAYVEGSSTEVGTSKTEKRNFRYEAYLSF